MGSNGVNDGPREIPDGFLYHVVWKMIDYYHDPSGASQKYHIYGSYVNLPTAKKAALKTLQDEGYEQSFFTTYEENGGQDDWKHGDAVMVHAVGPDGQVFTVSLDVADNVDGFLGDGGGRVEHDLYHM